MNNTILCQNIRSSDIGRCPIQAHSHLTVQRHVEGIGKSRTRGVYARSKVGRLYGDAGYHLGIYHLVISPNENERSETYVVVIHVMYLAGWDLVDKRQRIPRLVSKSENRIPNGALHVNYFGEFRECIPLLHKPRVVRLPGVRRGIPKYSVYDVYVGTIERQGTNNLRLEYLIQDLNDGCPLVCRVSWRKGALNDKLLCLVLVQTGSESGRE